MDRFSLSRVLRAVAPLVVLAALLPAAASAQTPGVGGYATSAPTTGAGTEEPAPATPSGAGPTTIEGSSTPNAAAPATSAPAQSVAAPSTGTLPFTGLQIAMMIAAGLGLLGLGVALRRVSGPALPGT